MPPDRPADRAPEPEFGPPEAEIRGLEPGEHHCHIFEAPAEALSVLVPFVRHGLEEDDKIVCTVNDAVVENLVEALQARGVDTQARLAAGDLTLQPADEGYGEASTFDIERRIDQLKSMARQAVEQGYGTLRSTGEMGWAARGRLERERLLTYEAQLNRFLGEGVGENVIGLCLYRRSAFEPRTIASILRAHPVAIHSSAVLENTLYEAPDAFSRPSTRKRPRPRSTGCSAGCTRGPASSRRDDPPDGTAQPVATSATEPWTANRRRGPAVPPAQPG